jgi:hypothetical protein
MKKMNLLCIGLCTADILITLILTINIILLLVISILGIIVHSSLTIQFGPVYIQNHFIGIWLCILILFITLFSIWDLVQFKLLSYIKQVYHISFSFICFGFNTTYFFGYFVFILVLGFLLLLGYLFGGHIYGIVWSFLILYAILINIFVVLFNNMPFKNESLIPKENKAKKVGDVFTQIIYWINFTTSVILLILKLLVFILFILLIIGSWNYGIGVLSYSYPPNLKGRISKVLLLDGRTQNIHVYCTGPTNSSKPTILFEADG